MLDSSHLRLTLLPLALLFGSMTACTSVPVSKGLLNSVSPYRFDRVQGNVVTREQVAALKTGMSRNMVRDILGTPLLTDVFHANRWDYVFTLQRQGAESQSRRVTVFFQGDKLDRFEAGDLPSETEFVATLKSMPNVGKLPPLEAPAENVQKTPSTARPQQPVVRGGGLPPADYPPLEPAAK